MRTRHVLVLAGFTAILVGQGCMTLPRPTKLWDPDHLESSPKFDGIKSLLDAHREVRLLVVHGMGQKKRDYSKDFRSFLQREMKLVSIGGCLQIDSLASPYGPWSFVRRCPYSHGTNRLTLYEYTWGDLTQVIADSLLKYDWDKGQGHADERVLGNRFLKSQIIDKSFSDAVAYAGLYAPVIQRATRRAICVVMTDGLEPSDCAFDKSLALTATAGPKIVTVSHSLGSMIVFEALDQMLSDTTKGKELVTAAEFVERLELVGMFANQLPLLWLSRIPGDSVRKFSVLRGSRSQLPIVAISDPNDLLSFPLDSGWPGRLGNSQVRVINARVSTAPHVVAGAVLPSSAHTNYWTDRCSVNLLVDGMPDCSSPPRIWGIHRLETHRPRSRGFEADVGYLLRPEAAISIPVYATLGFKADRLLSYGIAGGPSIRNASAAFQIRSTVTRLFKGDDGSGETLFGVGGRVSMLAFTAGLDVLRSRHDPRTRFRWSVGTGW